MKIAAALLLALLPSTTRREASSIGNATSRLAAVPKFLEMEDLNGGREVVLPFRLKRVPANVWALHGQRVRIRGFMYPTYDDHVNRFQLNLETKTCRPLPWFGRHWPVSGLVGVRLRNGRRIQYDDSNAYEVEGRLLIRPQRRDGVLFSLYDVVEADVKRVNPRKGYYRALGHGC